MEKPNISKFNCNLFYEPCFNYSTSNGQINRTIEKASVSRESVNRLWQNNPDSLQMNMRMNQMNRDVDSQKVVITKEVTKQVHVLIPYF